MEKKKERENKTAFVVVSLEISFVSSPECIYTTITPANKLKYSNWTLSIQNDPEVLSAFSEETCYFLYQLCGCRMLCVGIFLHGKSLKACFRVLQLSRGDNAHFALRQPPLILAKIWHCGAVCSQLSAILNGSSWCVKCLMQTYLMGSRDTWPSLHLPDLGVNCAARWGLWAGVPACVTSLGVIYSSGDA